MHGTFSMHFFAYACSRYVLLNLVPEFMLYCYKQLKLKRRTYETSMTIVNNLKVLSQKGMNTFIILVTQGMSIF